MADRSSRFESEIDGILQRLEDLERRYRALEDRVGPPASDVAASVAPAEPAGAPERGPFPGRLTPLALASYSGRTSLVIAGGYLLRALTESGLVPLPFGVACGLAYALIWLVLADRAGAARKDTSATFHGLAAAALAFPLLYEAAMTFRLVGLWTVSLGLTGVAALGITIAWRRWLPGMVWIFSLAAMATACVLLWAARDRAPATLHLALVAAMTYWAAHARPAPSAWSRVRWPAALVADAAVLWLATAAAVSRSPVGPAEAIAVAAALLLTSLGSVWVRTLALGHDASAFDLFQTAAVLLVACGGAVYVLAATQMNGTPYAAAALLLGALGYAVAFDLTAARLTRRNSQYFSSLALALVIAGGVLLLRPSIATMLWIALALATMWLGKHLAALTLSAHGAAYLTAATVASGAALAAGRGLLGSTLPSPRDLAPLALVALVAAAACSAISPIGVRTFGSKIVGTIAGRRWSFGAPRVVALGILVLGVTGMLVLWVAQFAASQAGAIATIRTSALALAVILMGALARGNRVPEAGWLIYPLLILAGVKILFEDLRYSDPSMLFVALLAYGVALLVAPRLASS